jgi:predicted nucleic acid-binding protein
VKVSAINYLVDAGPVIGFLDADDQWHKWSTETLAVLDEPLATTETVIAEAGHRLRKLRPALAVIPRLVAEGRLQLIPVFAEHPSRVGELLAKYPQMDVGDATLVVLSELCPRARLITVDDDFRHYRRFRNRSVPLVIPTRA